MSTGSIIIHTPANPPDNGTGADFGLAAATVDNDGRISTITDPTGLQDAATKNYVDSQIATAISNNNNQNSQLVSGGQIVWSTGLTYIVSAASYYILGVLYHSPQTNVTLTAADPTNNRIDAVVADTSNTVSVITGTAAANPSTPAYDPTSQILLGYILVIHGTTSPPGVVQTIVYAEDAGSPTEWNWTSSGSGWNLASTNNPRSGTKDIEATAVTSTGYVQGQIGTGTFDPNTQAQFVAYFRSKASWGKNQSLQVQLYNAGVTVGSPVTVGNGSFGFDSTITGSYQQVAIPSSQFAVPAGSVITQVRITRVGPGSIGFYLDDISWFTSSSSGGGSGSGITQLTGDVTAGPGSGSQVATLANSGVTAGTYGDSTHVSQVTVDAKGRVTAASNVAISGASGGTVTHTAGALTANELVVGNGSADIKVVAATDGQIPIGKTSDGSVTLGTITAGTGIAITNGAASVTVAAALTSAIVLVIDGAGSVITTGVKGFLYVPVACTITSVTLLSTDGAGPATSGSIVIDIWKVAYSSYPPTVSNTITASALPTLSSANKSQDSTLTGWTKSISAGDVLGFNVNSASTVTRVALHLKITIP